MSDLLTRLARAVHLDCEPIGNDGWRVTGGSAAHIVSDGPNGLECDCADFAMRRLVCKHIARILLALGDPETLGTLRLIVPMPRKMTVVNHRSTLGVRVQ